MNAPLPTREGRWGDLRKRVLSAIAMITVGAMEIWLGGTAFAALVIVLTGVMIWELATMTSVETGKKPLVLAGLAAVSLAAALSLRTDLAGAFLLIPSLVVALTVVRDRRLAAVYAAAVMVSGYGLVILRNDIGTSAILWLVAVVIISDVMGYFVGRIVGGPKFWPAISPKKTWSGTVAGWIGAALVGLTFWLAGWGAWLLIPVSAVVAFAGQLGDIAESWIKRRAGVKDASNLIPGHGGVMDRFDAMIGAIVLVMLGQLFWPLGPLFAG
ncbi:MAG: phosphatidate cytidylyltransferase [Tabrizicola sp.]|nr:phosphatidate cytidylyltransferase [Tabrizicola sp.]